MLHQNSVSVAGLFATHDRAPFYARVTIGMESGHIVKVEESHCPLLADHPFDANCLIFPGFSDAHIHAREDETEKHCYKETYQTAGDAALNGGVVLAATMPNQFSPLVGPTQLAWHRNRIEALDHPVVILNYVGVSTTTEPLGNPEDYPYKVFFGKSVGDLTIILAGDLDRALSRYRRRHVSFHVEYEPIVQMSAAGKTHSDRRPVACVNEGLRLLLPLILKYEIRAKLCHWSTGGESFRMIQEYRDLGCHIELEVSPLHLFYHTGMTDKHPSLWRKIQMNPAIQSEEHCLELIEGLRNGFIDMLATDHAPHTEEEKHLAFAKFEERFPNRSRKSIAELLQIQDPELYAATCVENNTSGAPWLDTFSLFCGWLMKEKGFTSQDIARVAAYNPGRFLNQFLPAQFPNRDFGKGFGEIAEGFMGSLTVLNLSKVTTVRRENLKTKVGWSPFEGHIFPVGLEAVFVGGKRY